jgi:hypothetical protein
MESAAAHLVRPGASPARIDVAANPPFSPSFERRYHLSFIYLFWLLVIQLPCCLGPDVSQPNNPEGLSMRTSKLTASTLVLCLAIGGAAFAQSASTTTTTEKPNGQTSSMTNQSDPSKKTTTTSATDPSGNSSTTSTTQHNDGTKTTSKTTKTQ